MGDSDDDTTIFATEPLLLIVKELQDIMVRQKDAGTFRAIIEEVLENDNDCFTAF